MGGVSINAIVAGGSGGGGATPGFAGVDGGSGGILQLAGTKVSRIPVRDVGNYYPPDAVEVVPLTGGGGGGGGGGANSVQFNHGATNGVANVMAPTKAEGGESGLDLEGNDYGDVLNLNGREYYPNVSTRGGKGGNARSEIASERDGEAAKIQLTTKNMLYGGLFIDKDRTGKYHPDLPDFYTGTIGPIIKVYRAQGVGTPSQHCDVSQFVIATGVPSSVFGFYGFYGASGIDDEGNELFRPGDYCLYAGGTLIESREDVLSHKPLGGFEESIYPVLNREGRPIVPHEYYTFTNSITTDAGPNFYFFKIDEEGFLDPKEGVMILLGPMVEDTGLSIKGRVFNDINYNNIWDNNEPAPKGLNLYVKLVSISSGITCNTATVASQAVAVNENGSYEFNNLNSGNYCVILTNNNTLSDLTPFTSDKWWYTQNPSGLIDNLLLSNLPLTDNNFGLTETPMLRISGRVYFDKNSDGVWNDYDAPYGLDLYVKLVAKTTAEQCLSESPVRVQLIEYDGSYVFTGVSPGNYCVILSDTNSNTVLSPYVPPPDWWYTQNKTATIHLNMQTKDSQNNNFGLTSIRMIRGTVFIDNGADGGIAYDGIKQEKEAVLEGAKIELFSVDVNRKKAVLIHTTTTNAAGEYAIVIPLAVPEDIELQVFPPLGTLSVSECVYSKESTSSLMNQCIPIKTINHSRLPIVVSRFDLTNRYLFGLAKRPTLESEQRKYARNGGKVNFFHSLTSYAAGRLTLNYARKSEQVSHFPITPSIYLDSNCNGELENTEVLISSEIPFQLNERKCFISEFSIPNNYPIDENDIVGTLTANFSYGIEKVAVSSHSVGLTIIVGEQDQGISLFKKVDKSTAQPGELLNYSIEYRNLTNRPIDNLVIRDKLAAYTDLVPDSVKCDELEQPVGVTCTIQSLLPEGDKTEREIIWIFNNPIPALSSGIVKYQLKLHL